MIKITKVKGVYFENAFKLTFPYNANTVNTIKKLTQRRYLPDERAWEIPVNELVPLIDLVGIYNISADDEIMKLVGKDEEVKESVQDRLKSIKPAIDFNFKTSPLPHQIEAFNFGLDKNCFLIGDEQGLGKTKEIIDITVARKDEIKKCLIICGVNSIKYNWEKEITKHSEENSLLAGAESVKDRVEQLGDWYASDCFYGIINIESIRDKDIQEIIHRGIKQGILGCIVVDEIHKAKNGNSLQGKALRMFKAPMRAGLSGTLMNKIEDLWNILTWLGVESRSFFKFRSAYCIMGGYGGYQVVGYKNLDSLNALLNTVMIRRKKEEVLDLPPKMYSTEYVELTHKQKLLYKDIVKEVIAEMEEDLASNKFTNINNGLVKTLRLRQLTGGLFTNDNPKLDRIKDLLENEIIPNGKKAIIFSQWESVTDVYKEALKQYNPAYIVGKVNTEDRQKEVDRFQEDDTCKIIIGTIGAMGTGLTLNRASYVFFIDKSYWSGSVEQAEDRAHRIGTVGTVNIISMIAKDTVDEYIEEYVANNKLLCETVIDGKGSKQDMRELMAKLLKI